jgi:hypothetical protein
MRTGSKMNDEATNNGNSRRAGPHKLWCAFACLLFCYTHTGLPAASSEAAIAAATPSDAFSSTTAPGGPDDLSRGAKEAAVLLGIDDEIQRLFQLRAGKERSDIDSMSNEELSLQVYLLDKITCASLEVRVVSDRIDRELSWSYTNQGAMIAKRQKTLNYLFTMNFMQGGILGTVAGYEAVSGKPWVTDRLLLVASAIGLGLSSASLVLSKSGNRKIDGGTTVLAQVFELPSFNPHKTDVIFKFLNAVPPGSADGKTRRQELIEKWTKAHRLAGMKEGYLSKLASIEGSGKENISLIGHRLRMLHDTQWTIEVFDEELLDLLRAMDRY